MKLDGQRCVTLRSFPLRGSWWKQDERAKRNGPFLGGRWSVLRFITFFLVITIAPLWIVMCWPSFLIPGVLTLFLLGTKCCSPNNLCDGVGWGGVGVRFLGGRNYGISSPGQSVIALFGLWFGINA